MTVQDLITNTLLLIRAVGTGETPLLSESNDALFALNDMVDGWQLERLLIPARYRLYIPLTAGTSNYWLGPGSAQTVNGVTIGAGILDVNGQAAPRPLAIHQAAFLDSSSNPPLERPLKIYTLKEYSRLTLPTQSSSYPEGIVFEPYFPNACVTLYPIPAASTLTLALTIDQQLGSFTSLSQTLTLPPGYPLALRYNLALELCEQYGVTPSETLITKAAEFKAKIAESNAARRPERMRSDLFARTGSIFNWRTGE